MIRQRWVTFLHFRIFLQENPQIWDQILIRQHFFQPLGGPKDPIYGFIGRYEEYLQNNRGDFGKNYFQPFFSPFWAKFFLKTGGPIHKIVDIWENHILNLNFSLDSSFTLKICSVIQHNLFYKSAKDISKFSIFRHFILKN